MKYRRSASGIVFCELYICASMLKIPKAKSLPRTSSDIQQFNQWKFEIQSFKKVDINLM